MKLFIVACLVALVFTAGIDAKNTPKKLKTASSEEVVVQEEAAESDSEENNVEVALTSDGDANTVNLLDAGTPEVSLVQNAGTKSVLSTGSSTNFVSPVKSVLTSAPLQTVNVLKSSPVQTVNVMKTAPVSKTVTYSQPQQQVVYSQPQQHVLYTQVQQPQQVVYTSQPQAVKYSWTQPQQQVVYSQPQQQVLYTQVQQPQQVTYTQPQQQVVYSHVPQQQNVVVMKGAPRQSVLRSTVQQWSPMTTVSKSVRLANPIVYSLTPTRPVTTYSKQTLLTGSQLAGDMSDSMESSKTDFISQETESYRK